MDPSITVRKHARRRTGKTAQIAVALGLDPVVHVEGHGRRRPRGLSPQEKAYRTKLAQILNCKPEDLIALREHEQTPTRLINLSNEYVYVSTNFDTRTAYYRRKSSYASYSPVKE